jgi:hypothetical protein
VRRFLGVLCGFAPLPEMLFPHQGSLQSLIAGGGSCALQHVRRTSNLPINVNRDAWKQKKMLKMQVAPNMLLKTKGCETTKCVIANMFIKTGCLRVLPIS